MTPLEVLSEISDEDIACIRAKLMEINKINEDSIIFNEIAEEQIAEDETDLYQPEDIDGPKTQSLLPAIHDFCLDSLTETERQRVEEIIFCDFFCNLSFYRDQIEYVCDQLRNCENPLSFGKIGMIFRKNKGTIKNQYIISKKGNHINGRPSFLNQKQLTLTEEFIMTCFLQKEPVSYVDLFYFFDNHFGLQLNMDTIRHIVYKFENFKTITGKPMEDERIMCDTDEIDEYFNHIEQIIGDIHSSFVYNIDESGFQDWADQREMRVIVPIDFEDDTIPISVRRNSKRTSILGGICTDGSYLKPLIIAQRKTIESEIEQLGYNEDNIFIRYQENGFITTEIFNEWAREIFSPEIMRKRILLDYSGLVLLILDGCSCHISDEFLDLCTDYGVEPLFMPAHSSDQIQPLDLVIFGLMKTSFHNYKIDPKLNPQTREIIKIHHAWVSNAYVYNITQAFRKAGICRERDCHGKIHLLIKREEARQVRHWNFGQNEEYYQKERIPMNKSI